MTVSIILSDTLSDSSRKNYFIVCTWYLTLSRHAIVKLPHPQSRHSHGQKTFLAPSVDKQTRNYETECSKHHPSQSPKDTGIDLWQDKMVRKW